MLYRKHSDDDYSIYITPKEYNVYLDSAVSSQLHRGIRLGGHSLRQTEVLRARRGDLYREQETGDYYLRVRDCKKSDYNASDPIPEYPDPEEMIEFRQTRLSEDLAEEILSDLEGADDDARLLYDIESSSTYQRRLNTTGEIAAEKTGVDLFKYATQHDFRRYFAMQLIIRSDIDNHIALKWGGWSSVESVLDYIVIPPDYAKNQLEQGGFHGQSIDRYDPRDSDKLKEILIEKIDNHFEEIPEKDIQRKDVHEIIKKVEEKTDYDIEIVGSSDSQDPCSDDQFENPSQHMEIGDNDNQYFSTVDPVSLIWTPVLDRASPVIRSAINLYQRFEQTVIRLVPYPGDRAKKAYNLSFGLFLLILFIVSIERFMTVYPAHEKIARGVILIYLYIIAIETGIVDNHIPQ